MKKKSISTSIIVLLALSSLLALPTRLSAQSTKFLKDGEKQEKPFFQGIMVGVDVFGFLNQALGSDVRTTEVSIEANLQNRFLPIVEIGYGSTNAMDEETEIHFQTSAPFFRVGMNYNVFYQKPELPGCLTVGLRYGFSSFTYDMQSPDLVDPNWNHTHVPVNYTDVKSNVGWLEAVVGMRANVFKDFYLGLNVRYRSRLSMTKNENSEPYYIPGYGRGKPNNFGITYSLIYKLPFL
jgi:hypothetical protein